MTDLRRILLLVALRQLNVEDALSAIKVRSTSVQRDTVLVLLGATLGLWAGVAVGMVMK